MKLRRLEVPTLLRLLEPRSGGCRRFPHTSGENRVHCRVTGPFPFLLRQGYGGQAP